jgi:competence protein ComEC
LHCYIAKLFNSQSYFNGEGVRLFGYERCRDIEWIASLLKSCKDECMRVLVMAIGILVLLVLVRAWGWWDDWQKTYCVGCVVDTEVVWWREARENPYFLSIEVDGVDWQCKRKEASCREWSSYQWGDRVRLQGTVDVWEVDGVERARQVQVADSTMLVRAQGFESLWWEVYGSLMQFRTRIVRGYERTLPEPHAGLVAGIVLGERRTLQPEFYDALIRTGTLHVVAASGYNITVVANVLLTALVVVMHRKRALVVAGAGVWAYVVLAGMNPPVVRAGIMGMLVLLSQGTGRAYWASWGLVISSMIMLLIAPWWVRDVSFQLSVAATAGVMWGVGPVGRLISSVGDMLGQVLRLSGIRRDARSAQDDTIAISSLATVSTMRVLNSDLATTLAATLATLPITLVVFGRVSLISPIVNVLTLWLVPPIMGLGALLGLAGLVSEGLAQVAAFTIMPLTGLFVAIVTYFAKIPWASVVIAGANWWVGVGWWFILAGWWVHLARHHHAQRDGGDEKL